MTKGLRLRLRPQLCLLLAASAGHCNAFVETIHCKTPNTKTNTNALNNHSPQQHDYDYDYDYNLNDAVTTTLGVDSELSEFLGRSVMPGIGGVTTATDSNADVPLFMSSSTSDEQREFEMMIGRALDTLRKDYPEMLTKDPDFSIYHSQIEAVDPKGITLHSLSSYKTSFQFLHTIIKFFYDPEQSLLTFRLVYDCARKSIRVSWNAELIPRSIYGGIGVNNKLYVDGISVYEFERESGLINQHRVERLLMNDKPVEAPQGIFSAIAGQAKMGLNGPDVEGVPVWNVKNVNEQKGNTVVEFTPPKKRTIGSIFQTNTPKPTSVLFSSTNSDFQHPLFNQEEFDAKNASRKKFGVKPLTPAEYVEIQVQVKDMEHAQDQKRIARATELANEPPKKQPKESLFGKMFGNILQDTCQSNFDCERPEICCDLGFKKMCCSSGMRVFDPQPGLQKIPLRVIADDGQNYPRGGPDGMDNYY